jgi:hypothetical protein
MGEERGGSWGLEELLRPRTPEEFLRDHWEKAPLHVGERDQDFYPRWFGLMDVESWLWSQRRCDDPVLLLTAPGLRWEKRAPSRTSIEQIAEAFLRGETLQINGIQETSLPLAGLAHRLRQQVDARVHINVYLTPGGCQGLARHADTHDVLVLQLEGSKRWQVFDGLVPLPTPEATVSEVDYPYNLRELGQAASEAPLLDVCLRPGSLLYVPRGFPHEAQALPGEVSVHLAVGIYPQHGFDVLHLAVAAAALRRVEFRRALRPGWWSGEGEDHALLADLASLARSLSEDTECLRAALDLARARHAESSAALPGGHLRLALRGEALALGSRLVRREGLLCAAQAAPPHAMLRFGSRHLRGPGRLLPVFRFIAEREAFLVSELPLLDDPGKLVLARRLLLDGVVSGELA